MTLDNLASWAGILLMVVVFGGIALDFVVSIKRTKKDKVDGRVS